MQFARTDVVFGWINEKTVTGHIAERNLWQKQPFGKLIVSFS